jgi:O-antigen/teichoic acid export membrane protein
MTALGVAPRPASAKRGANVHGISPEGDHFKSPGAHFGAQTDYFWAHFAPPGTGGTLRREKLSLYRNSLFLMSTTVANAGLGYMYWLIAAREVNAASVGLAAGCIGAFGALSYLASVGIQSTCVQILPRLTDDKRRWNEFFTAALVYPTILATALGTLGAVLLGSFSHHYADLLSPGTLALFVFGTCASSISLAVDACFISLRRSGRQFVRNLLFGALKLAVLVIPLALSWSATTDVVIFSWAFGVFASSLIVLVFLLPPVRPQFRLRLGGWPALLAQRRLMTGYLLSSLGGLLPTYLFPVIVVAVLGDTQNAYFYFTWSTGFIFFMVSASIAQALFSESVNTAQLTQQVKKAAIFISVILIPIGAGVYLFGGHILALFGSKYRTHGTGLLRICVISSVPDAITNVYVTILFVTRRVTQASILNLAMAAVAIGGASVLLPSLGINGVGWAWLAAQTLGSIGVGIMLLVRRAPSRPPAYQSLAAS